MKNSRVTTYIDEAGVKHTIGEYHEPRPSERTWTLLKSKHSLWTQGVQMSHSGALGTYSINIK